MAADFGLGDYSDAELSEIFGLLRGLRLAAGDFVPEAPEEPSRSSGPVEAGSGD
jgi:hypothetical protein